jgi:glycolate oxidase
MGTRQEPTSKANCSREKEDLACYAYDATARTYMPDAVLFPQNSSEVSAILRLANKHGFFVIPRGSGSGMTGGSLAVSGGVIIVMTRFNRILQIDRENLIAHLEPGVVTGHLHKAVEKESLFYPPDPSSSEFSTYVLGLEVVLPSGEIITTGVQTAKGVVGYDLTRLIIGSEGTLGIITRITVRLLPLPEVSKTITAVFDKIETAAETVSEIIRNRIIPRTMEYMDNASIRCVENYLKIGLPVKAEALLLIKVDGNEDEVNRAANELKTLCINRGATSVEKAKTKEEAANIWKARKAISPALFSYGPDKINEDIVVPRSKIPDMVKKINMLRDETGLCIVSFGHAGDGNIHFNIMLDKQNKAELKKAETVVEALFDYTLELGGTISGEHGIGITKAPYIKKEIGDVELSLMKKIKNVFDPKGILNPGKIFP